MIGSTESAYSENKLRSYRRLYPLLGLIGKPKDYRRFLSNANAILRFDARDVQIGCPTLILGGEEDKTVGPEGSKASFIPSRSVECVNRKSMNRL